MKNNKRMRHFLVLMLGIGSARLLLGENQARTPMNLLNGCECWSARNDALLEVGNVILRFSEYPVVSSLPSTAKNAQNHHIFFIPVSGVSSDEIRFLMQAASKNTNKWYSVSLSLEKKPTLGIKVVLTYDPEKVTMEHATFDTLGSRGVSFRLYNKLMIDKLRSNERSLLRVAHIVSNSTLA